MKQSIMLVLVTLSLFVIVSSQGATVVFKEDEAFNLRVNAVLKANNKDIVIQYYRKDGAGDILQKNAPAWKEECHLFRINPKTYYIFEAYEDGVLIAQQEIFTKESCSLQLTDDLIRIVGATPTFDIIIAEIQIQYKLFGFDKYGQIVWCCYMCGPLNTPVYTFDEDEDNFFVVQDKLYGEDRNDIITMYESHIMFENKGTVRQMSLSGQTIEIIGDDEQGFTHELTADPFNNDWIYTIGDGRTDLADMESHAIYRIDLHDGAYEKIIDAGRYFNSVEDWGFLSGVLNWMHGNAVHFSELDNSFIFSMNQISTVASFNYDTKDMQWTLSGEIDCDFTFPNLEDRFFGQHDANQLPNGNILLFDNGNIRPEYKGPKMSRGLELELDMEKMEARVVWQFWTKGWSEYKGSCRRLPNGNTMVYCAHCEDSMAWLWEVAADESIVAEISWPVDEQWYSYRAYPIPNINGEVIVSPELALGNIIEMKTTTQHLHKHD